VPFGLAGARYDPMIAGYALGSRCYDPALGRFTTRDTWPSNVWEPWTWNLYQYCKNSPQNYVDPTGHQVEGAVQQFPEFAAHVCSAVSSIAASMGMTGSMVAAALAAVSGAPAWLGVGFLIGYGVSLMVNQASKAAASEPGSGTSSGTSGADPGNQKTPYDIAAEGGKHAGFLKTYLDRPPSEVARAVRSLGRQVQVHMEKTSDPAKYYPDFWTLDPTVRQRLIQDYWPKEMANLMEQMQILQEVLRVTGNKR